MTTENEVVTETAAEPVIDTTAAEQAKRDAEMEVMLDDMKKLAAEQAVLAAEQDAALAAVKAACDAEREALKQGV